MGEHKYNPTASAAARGELDRSARVRPPQVGSRFGGSVTNAVDAEGKPVYFTNARGFVQRVHPKVKGKANVKRVKRARMLAGESAARLSA